MDRLDRIYELHRLLKAARYPIARQRLAEQLQCSDSTLYHIRNRLEALGAPIDTDEQTGGWRYAKDELAPFELPGLWFSGEELHALLSADQLLANVQPGLLDEDIGPLRKRLRQLLENRHTSANGLASRVRILGMADRPVDAETFRNAATALAQRRRLHCRYHARGSDETSARTVSPQRLTRYRDNWYLDAWCHSRKALRSFSLDRMTQTTIQTTAAKTLDDKTLEQHYASAYGIFSGTAQHTAVLRFSAQRARWVGEEHWHPQQQSRWLEDGRYELRIPYQNPIELILDILRYGAEVEVIAPDILRKAVIQKLRSACAQYDDN